MMGYTWDGMVKITEEQAVNKFADTDEEVYLLYDDNSESLVECFSDILNHLGEYGFQKEERMDGYARNTNNRLQC